MKTKLPRQSFLALAAIGWADGQLQRVESSGLLRAAKECGLDGDDLAAVEAATKVNEKRGLEGIDLSGLSRWEQVLTYALATWLTAVDGVVSTSEQDTLTQVGDSLGLDPALRKRAAAAAYDIYCLTGASKPERYDFAKLADRLVERMPQLAKE
jgi:tellurite resistance protein